MVRWTTVAFLCCHAKAFVRFPAGLGRLPYHLSNRQQFQFLQRPYTRPTRSVLLLARPKKGGVVNSYQSVSVNCSKCKQRLFRYKKKNGTKSNLVKCYIERIVEDSAGVLEAHELSGEPPGDFQWQCPNCHTKFARSALIHGRPALKMVGGKVRMTKK